MSEITYESIQNLVDHAEQDGRQMKVTFKCPATQDVIASSATIQAGKELKDVAMASAKKSVMYSVRRTLMSTIRSVLGGGMFGKVGRDVASELMRGMETKAKESYSEAEKQAAVVAAFEAVKTRFAWDGKNQRWVSAQGAGNLLSDFDKQLGAHPVTQTYDRGILARMLVQVSAADGHLADEEKEFLSTVVTSDLGSIDDLLKSGNPSAVELSEVSQGGIRETLLMMSWTVALTDEELADAEQQLLVSYAQGLTVADDRAQILKGWAQHQVLGQAMSAIYASGATAEGKQKILQIAQQIGVSAEDAERAEIRYRKQYGLI